MRYVVMFLALFVLLFSQSSLQAQDSLTVDRMVICKHIVDREPEGAATAFPDTLSRVYCFTHIKGAKQETQIKHRWYRGDSLMAEVTLPVRSVSWRTWSSKNLVKGWHGSWRVKVVGPEGAVLRETKFTIEKSE